MAKSKFNNKQKYEIVKKVLTSDLTVTEACKIHSVSASQYYRWQDQFLQGAKESFESVKQGRKSTKLEREKASLESEVQD